VSAAPAVGALIELDGPEAKHAISVRRMKVGEAIQLSNGSGLRIRGRVHSLGANALVIEVFETVDEPMPSIQFYLAQALAKGDRDELAIQAATELGIFGIYPWQSDRSVSRWDGAKIEKGKLRWQTIVNEAAKQSLRVFEPEVFAPHSSKQLAAVFAQFDLVIILDPTADAGITSAKLPNAGRVMLVVGPEGGISEHELDTFQKAGATRAHLGAPILRTSTAGVAALSALLSASGTWA
jgi:16S rRNA (uracil1498-N3)-methyltransferase